MPDNSILTSFISIGALCIFINPHTLLTPLLEAIELYVIIWQVLHTVKHSNYYLLLVMYTRTCIVNITQLKVY